MVQQIGHKIWVKIMLLIVESLFGVKKEHMSSIINNFIDYSSLKSLSLLFQYFDGLEGLGKSGVWQFAFESVPLTFLGLPLLELLG